MATFMSQSDYKSHADHIPRGSSKMDPYTKSALTMDDVKQVEITIKRKPIFSITSGLCGVHDRIAKDILNHIYGSPTTVNSMTELEKAYYEKDVEDTLKCIGPFFSEDRITDFVLKQRLNESVNKEIT